MFITSKYNGYDRHDQQIASGNFLILLNKNVLTSDPVEYRAVVRKVKMSQFGHFMMGIARVFNYSLTLSGAYGNDGLPIAIDDTYVSSSPGIKDIGKSEAKRLALLKLWNSAIPVPDDLIEKWNTGGGWNDSGSETTDMRQWAITTFIKGNK